MKRDGYFEIARRDNGWLVRWRGGNHALVLSSSDQLYPRRRGAENAILSVARAFVDSAVTIIPDQGDGLGSYVWHEPTGIKVEVREVDERYVPPPVELEPPFYLGFYTHYSPIPGSRRMEPECREFWHDHAYHYRQCSGDDCSEGTPANGTEVRGRFGTATYESPR